MKITQLECWPISFELSEPFQIAYETIENFDNVILRAATDSGLTGWSCAAPDRVITGETADSVLSAFSSAIEPILHGSDPFRYAWTHTELRSVLAEQRSAWAMADMLLYDLMAKAAGQPLYRILGGYRESILTSVTIGILPLEATLQKAKSFVKQGFRSLKLKGGLNVDEDIERTRKVREAIGHGIELRFDGNQGYTAADALKYAKQTAGAMVALLEQPTPRGQEEQLEELVDKCPIPIVVDESMNNLQDIFRLARNDRADMVNIKLMKVGGITEAAHINSVAQSASLECMVGCLDECELGIAFGLHFSLAHPNAICADLDGAIDIVRDPFRGLVRIDQGVMYPLAEPGIGRPAL